ncbi:hypothetical protein EYF80_050434 [Liparis tanakae]|uniref:Uncharacterized protein n=1 Tax=Liparis tanakae TaxID=230148 RepID=A0A4Z2FF56_9TELE|nr:hypothetical protein EYF80_050434 [Liparis tanakae]
MEDRTCSKVQVQVSERQGKVFDLEVKSKVCEGQVKVRSQVFDLEVKSKVCEGQVKVRSQVFEEHVQVKVLLGYRRLLRTPQRGRGPPIGSSLFAPPGARLFIGPPI